MTVQAESLRPIALPRIRLTARARALAPAGAYLSGQAVVLAFALWVAHERHASLYKALAAWDGQWFLAIAEHGYRHSVEPGTNSVGYFPGYPVTLRWLHTVTRVPFQQLGIILSIGAGIVAAYGLMRLVADRRTGLVLVALFATAPMSIVLAMTYSEALFCALAVWALVCLRDGRWLSAAALIVAAGLTRNTGLALVVALIFAVAVAAKSGRATPRTVAALAIAPAGLVGYMAWVNIVTHTPKGWFVAQRKGWGTHFDWGVSTAKWAYQTAYSPGFYSAAAIGLIIAAAGLTVRLALRGELLLAVYAGMVLAADVVTAGPQGSKIRLLIPAFPLLIPLAQWLLRQPRWGLAAVMLAGAWYSSYGLLTFGHVYAI